MASPRVAAREGDAAVVWMTARGGSGPNVFFASLDRELRPCGATLSVDTSTLVASLAATADGYLVASYSEGAVLVHRVGPGVAPVLAGRLPGTYQLVDLATSRSGDVLLTTLDGGGAFEARMLDARGVPRAMTAGPLHATGWFGRVLIAPLAAGEVQAEGAASVTVRSGDRLVVWVRASMGLCGVDGCEVRVDVVRGEGRVGGLYLDHRGDGAPVALALPGDASVRLTQVGGTYDDEYAPGTGGEMPLRASGSMRARSPGGVRIFAAQNVQEQTFTAMGGGFFLGAAVFVPTQEYSDDGGAPRRLLLARVRP